MVSRIFFGLGKETSGGTNLTGEMVRRRNLHVRSFVELEIRQLHCGMPKAGDLIRNRFTFVSVENLKPSDFAFRQIRRRPESDALPGKRSLVDALNIRFGWAEIGSKVLAMSNP